MTLVIDLLNFLEGAYLKEDPTQSVVEGIFG